MEKSDDLSMMSGISNVFKRSHSEQSETLNYTETLII